MRRRSIAANLALALIALLLSLLVLELALRVRPTMLGEGFATGALTKYTTRPGGIYYATAICAWSS